MVRGFFNVLKNFPKSRPTHSRSPQPQRQPNVMPHDVPGSPQFSRLPIEKPKRIRPPQIDPLKPDLENDPNLQKYAYGGRVHSSKESGHSQKMQHFMSCFK